VALYILYFCLLFAICRGLRSVMPAVNKTNWLNDAVLCVPRSGFSQPIFGKIVIQIVAIRHSIVSLKYLANICTKFIVFRSASGIWGNCAGSPFPKFWAVFRPIVRNFLSNKAKLRQNNPRTILRKFGAKIGILSISSEIFNCLSTSQGC